MKPGAPPLQYARLLDQVRELVRCLHYSVAADDKASLHPYWIRFQAANDRFSATVRTTGICQQLTVTQLVYDFRNLSVQSNTPQIRMDARPMFTTLLTCLRL
jgi:hypothetical protein